MYRLTYSIILVFVFSSLGTAQSFFDDFEDGEFADGAPITWSPAAFGSASVDNGDLVLTPTTGECCFAAVGLVDHRSLEINAVFEFPEPDNYFVGTGFRQTSHGIDESYWVGAFPTGEIFIGYTDPSIVIAIQGKLPSGSIAAGTDVSYHVELIDNELSFTAWETALGRDQGSTIRWTDPLNRYPSGNEVYPFINPQGNLEAVRVRSFGVTIVPEPAGCMSACLALGVVLLRRRGCLVRRTIST